MIKIDILEESGIIPAIYGMRNPMNSRDKADTTYGYLLPDGIIIGESDEKLMRKLIKAGPDHRKFLRMMTIYLDIYAPLYWWKEFDTYKVGTVANSSSTMHTVHKRDLTIEDFSTDHLDDNSIECLNRTIQVINNNRKLYLETNDKKYWWQMIQLLPSNYNQLRTVVINYETLINILNNRSNHKLDEWVVFCSEVTNNCKLTYILKD